MTPVPPVQLERGKGQGLSRLEAEAVALAAAHAEVHGVGRVPRVPFECRLWFRLLLLLPFELFAGLLGRCGEAHGPLPLLLGLLLGLPDGTGLVCRLSRVLARLTGHVSQAGRLGGRGTGDPLASGGLRVPPTMQGRADGGADAAARTSAPGRALPFQNNDSCMYPCRARLRSS